MDSQDFQIFDGDISADRLAAYMDAEALAVDTETMGLVTLRDRLCLVQICDERDRLTVVRIAKGQTTAPHIKQLFEATNIPKIFHFARFDITALQHYLDIYVQPIFCTKIASKLVRTYGAGHGLKSLILETVGIELDKSAQCSDWGNAANLSDEQLRYAANDVRYLIPARQHLIEMLQRENRLALAEQCFQCLPTFANLDLLQYNSLFEH